MIDTEKLLRTAVTRLAAIIVFSTAALLLIAIIVFFGIGHWLVVEDPLEKADAIVVLSGRLPERATEAARLYKAGYAPQVWLTRPSQPPELQEMHIAYLGEEFYNTQVLMHEGVPLIAVHVLEPTVWNTADEIEAVSAELQRVGAHKVIIVTSKSHTRRVRTLWRDLAPTGRALTRAPASDDFQSQAWWHNTRDALQVLRESLGLLNAWSGLPIKPAR